MRIALSQLVSDTDPAENVHLVRHEVRRAAAQGARVIVFPEAMMARFGSPLHDLAEPLDGPWASAVAGIADEHDVAVIAGMFTPGDSTRVKNTLLVTGLGHHLGYDKIHVYDAFGFTESGSVVAGDATLTLEIDDITLGFATCYDVRFPELFRALADRGASVVALSASWGAGEGKREQWDTLVRARALDSGCWVLACDQADPSATGVDVDRCAPTGIGYSTAADGFGRIHHRLGAAPELVVVDVDAATASAARAATGVLANRRL